MIRKVYGIVGYRCIKISHRDTVAGFNKYKGLVNIGLVDLIDVARRPPDDQAIDGRSGAQSKMGCQGSRDAITFPERISRICFPQAP